MARMEKCLGEYESIDAAWRAMVQSITSDGIDVAGSVDPLSVGSTFGKKPRGFRELLGSSIVVHNPRNRLTRSEVRPVHLDYLLANVVWAAIGSDELARIAFYNSRGRDFSDDCRTLAAAPGKRMFRSSNGDQFTACAALLLRDPSTRRAVMSLFIPDDVGSTHRDCSCVLTIQFVLRQQVLHCVVGMRSQSALMVFPYDAFLLTIIHESMAVEIGACLGSLHFHYGSLHYYDDEASVASRLLLERPQPSISMPEMRCSIRTVAATLARAEQAIRNGDRVIDQDELDVYWMTYLESLAHAVKGDELKGRKNSLPESLINTWYGELYD